MRLAIKLMTVYLAAILLVTGVYGYLAVQREEQIFEERAHAEVESLALAMETKLRAHGAERAVEMLREMPIQGYGVQVRWVWFDAPHSDPFGPVASIERWEMRTFQSVVAVPDETLDGTANLYAYRPLEIDSRRPGGLEFAYPLAMLERAKREAILETLTLLAGLVSVTGFTVVIAGVILVGKPLRRLIDKTREMADGELQNPVRLKTGDELSELADSLNDLGVRLAESQEQVQQEAATRIAAIDQLRHADRLRTVGRMASGIAHELGTPLNVISGRAHLIAEQQLPVDKVIESAATIERESARMTTIIRQLLAFARRDEPHRTRADVGAVAKQTIELLSPLAAHRQIRFELELATEPAFAEIDVAQFQQVLTNVFMNAIQASPDGSPIWVAVAAPSEETRGEGNIRVTIRDEGEGIPTENQQQIFEPFFTTKDVGEGTGLGLSIAYRILEEHGGRIEVDSEPGKGSRFTIILP
jgi:two-component system NtrC family sensor kinase